MTDRELLIRRITQLSDDEISCCYLMLKTKEITPKLDYGAYAIIRYDHKCRKQRFLCKTCGRTFVPTTNTIMSNSRFPAFVWKEIISIPHF